MHPAEPWPKQPGTSQRTTLQERRDGGWQTEENQEEKSKLSSHQRSGPVFHWERGEKNKAASWFCNHIHLLLWFYSIYTDVYGMICLDITPVSMYVFFPVPEFLLFIHSCDKPLFFYYHCDSYLNMIFCVYHLNDGYLNVFCYKCLT